MTIAPSRKSDYRGWMSSIEPSYVWEDLCYSWDSCARVSGQPISHTWRRISWILVSLKELSRALKLLFTQHTQESTFTCWGIVRSSQANGAKQDILDMSRVLTRRLDVLSRYNYENGSIDVTRMLNNAQSIQTGVSISAFSSYFIYSVLRLRTWHHRLY